MDKPSNIKPQIDVNDPSSIVAAGKKIYLERYKAGLEPGYNGDFAVIDVLTESISVAEEAVKALDLAKERNPDGIFYLLRIGFDAAYALRSPRNLN